VSVGGEIWQVINTVRERKTLPIILTVHVMSPSHSEDPSGINSMN